MQRKEKDASQFGKQNKIIIKYNLCSKILEKEKEKKN